MKKTRILIITLLFASVKLFAQDENELSRHKTVNEFVSELISKKIDTICDYEVFTEKTDAMYTQYVFWKENGKTNIKKLELENNYPIIETNAEEIWNYLLQNNDAIKNEDVKTFSISENINGQNQVQTIISQGNHFREFNLYLVGNITKFWTSSFDFQKNERFDRKKFDNVYFEHNNNLKGKLVLDKFEDFLKKLEKERVFKK